MSEENISQAFRMKNIDATTYFIEEINQNDLVSKIRKRVCGVFNYIEHLLILASTVFGCIFISVFASLDGIPVGIACLVIGLCICTITAGIKKYTSTSIIKKKKKHDK